VAFESTTLSSLRLKVIRGILLISHPYVRSFVFHYKSRLKVVSITSLSHLLYCGYSSLPKASKMAPSLVPPSFPKPYALRSLERRRNEGGSRAGEVSHRATMPESGFYGHRRRRELALCLYLFFLICFLLLSVSCCHNASCTEGRKKNQERRRMMREVNPAAATATTASPAAAGRNGGEKGSTPRQGALLACLLACSLFSPKDWN
jgi:hypothetical protein